MGLSDVFARSLYGGFQQGISAGWRPKRLTELARDIIVPRRDTVRVYGLTDLALPTRNALAVDFESLGAWFVDIATLDNWDKGFKFTAEDESRLPEIVAKGREIPLLFGRAYDDHLMTLIVEGDTTTYMIPGQGVMWGGAAVTFFSGTGAGHIYTGGAVYTTAQLNLLQAAEVTALNITTPTAPTEAEWKSAMEGIKNYIFSNSKDTSGANLWTGDEPVDIYVPVGLEMSARGAFEARTITTGGENVYTSILNGGKIYADPRLTDTAVWYAIIRPGGMERPFWHPRGKIRGKEVEFVSTDEQSDAYVQNSPGQIYVRSSMYSKLTYGDWRLAYRCVFS